MIQKNKVLTTEDSRISPICARRTTAQEDCLAITERELPMNTTEETWIFEVGEKICVGRTTPKLVNTLVKVIKWLNHLGSGRVDDIYLESRHNIHDNPRIKGIGL
jgi:hypothetical protein